MGVSLTDSAGVGDIWQIHFRHGAASCVRTQVARRPACDKMKSLFF